MVVAVRMMVVVVIEVVAWKYKQRKEGTKECSNGEAKVAWSGTGKDDTKAGNLKFTC